VDGAQGGLALSAGDLRADCDALVPIKRGGSPGQCEPQLVAGTITITQGQRIRLAFAAHVLAEKGSRCSKYGTVVPFNGTPQRIRLQPLYPQVKTIINALREWSTGVPTDPPPLVLARHCAMCPFHPLCHKEAEKQDNLSLLERMTPKVMQKYRKKGIFTVEQLSYAYRPRRRRKRRANAPTVFNIELQALALRTGKVYLHELPTLPKHPIELFLDIEGLPDEDRDYLIGLDIREGDQVTSHSFWANSANEEVGVFKQCLNVAYQYPDAPIFHYGSYEPRAFARVAKKHGLKTQGFIQRLVNVNSAIFGKVYFPARSNRLKDLGGIVGVTWRAPDASGLQSIAWRWRWEGMHDDKYKDLLIDYNRTDCTAVRLLLEQLRSLGDEADSRADVDFADAARGKSTVAGKDIHRALKGILRSGHYEYESKRIRIGRLGHAQSSEGTESAGQPNRSSWHRLVPSKANRVVNLPRRRTCPRDKTPLRRSQKLAERFVTDLEFTKSGCRRVVVKYVGEKGYCPRCKRSRSPAGIARVKERFLGRRMCAWMCYLRVSLRLPYEAIGQMLEDVFGEHVSVGSVAQCIQRVAESYGVTERALLRTIIGSPFAHADETKVSIHGKDQYVWVVTNGQEVIFRLTETRETTMMRKLLSGFGGVLVSDFYAGYDSVECRQQKCFGHLIGDLNDDLWKNPYNTELETFIGYVRDLLVPIFQAVNRFGLKAYHLKKFMGSVDRFYDRRVVTSSYACEITEKYRKRFMRYRESLFRFLVEDGIPWNNNAAERAIRHLAVQRKISGAFGEHPMHQYLRLLGISQTCRFQGKSFLKFLLSGERDVDKFKPRKLRRMSRASVTSKRV
jgi:predicted RecB family nuclease